jgi:hypothetical protein
MLRVASSSGKPVERLVIEGAWEPSGRPLQLCPFIASGMCMIPWRSSERRLSLLLSNDSGEHAELQVERDRPQPFQAFDVRLSPREISLT